MPPILHQEIRVRKPQLHQRDADDADILNTVERLDRLVPFARLD
jgi:hypothetical protein